MVSPAPSFSPFPVNPAPPDPDSVWGLTDEWGDGRGEHRTALDNEGHASAHHHGKVACGPGEGGGKVCEQTVPVGSVGGHWEGAGTFLGEEESMSASKWDLVSPLLNGGGFSWSSLILD